MKAAQTLPQRLGMLSVLLALCSFVLVVTYRWTAHTLPTSGNVLAISFVGMSIVGGAFGFCVSVLTILALRQLQPKQRVLSAAISWVAFCAGVFAWLQRSALGDYDRTLALTLLAAFWGLLAGPYNAELVVTYELPKGDRANRQPKSDTSRGV